MKCTNCGKEMKPVYSYVWCQTDPDESYHYISGFICRDCKITFDNTRHNWILPPALRPTKKQLNTEKYILNRLEVDSSEYPITKKQYIKFIGKYLPLATKVTFDYPDDYSEGINAYYASFMSDDKDIN